MNYYEMRRWWSVFGNGFLLFSGRISKTDGVRFTQTVAAGVRQLISRPLSRQSPQLAAARKLPKVYQNFVIVQISGLVAGNLNGASEVENLRNHAREQVCKFVAYMNRRGYSAEARFALGTDIVDEAAKLCDDIAETYSQVQFFAGQLAFEDESFITH
jgi:hypothetical protein